MKIGIRIIVIGVFCLANSSLFCMRDWWGDDCHEYHLQDESAIAASVTSMFIDVLLSEDEKDKGSRVIGYFKDNWDIVKEKTFKAYPNSPYNRTLCGPLRYLADVKLRTDLAYWLLMKGAQPLDEEEVRSILEAFIKHDQEFNNKALRGMIKDNAHILYRVDFIDLAKKYKNAEAEYVLSSILRWKKCIDTIQPVLGNKLLSLLEDHEESDYLKDIQIKFAN